MVQAEKIGAFFDFDGTLYDGVVAFDFLRFAIRHKAFKLKEMARLPKFLYYYALDKFKIADRYDVNIRIYKKVKDWNSDKLRATAEQFFKNKARKNIIPDMIKILKEHKANGHAVIIVTSALKQIVEPIAEWLEVDELIASEVETNNSKFTGNIINLPVGKNRIITMREYCRQHSIDLSKSYGYSDHYSDIPMLKNVGKPVATNPERKMRRYAKKQGWEIVDC